MSIGGDTDTEIEEEMDELMDVCMLTQLYNRYTTIGKQPCRTSALSGYDYVQELLLGHLTRIYEMFRMDSETFMSLCNTLRNRFIDESSHRHVPIEESVAIFLLTVCHSTRHKVVAERFQHATETINRHFKEVLRAIAKLGVFLILPKQPYETAPEILNNHKFNPYFVDCIGAIDGTHVAAWVPASKQIAFRGRKTTIIQNVLATCSFDMLFTFVYTGWEGSANDSRVFLNAITQQDLQFPLPPTGKYYVVDAGFTNVVGFLAPYRGEPYHLAEFQARGHGPRGPRELFNHRHSSLRNVIERCFGVLKKRFPILKHMTNYKVVRQGLVVIACCTIHNFIRMHSRRDEFFNDFNIEEMLVPDEANLNGPRPEVDMSQEQANAMATLCNEIAAQMWLNHNFNGQ